MANLTNDILGNFGSVQENSFTHILESSDDSRFSDDNQPNLLTESPYTCSDNITDFNTIDGFNVMSLNCRSINSSIDSIRNTIQILHDSGYTIHCIALQETWITESNLHIPSLNINGYDLVHQPCRLSSHSGVAFYLDSNFSYQLTDHPFLPDTFETLSIKVNLPNKSILLSNVYRPPRPNIEVFNREIEILLDVLKGYENIMLMGDFNINLLDINTNQDFQTFLDICFSHSLCPKITLPSRVANRSATLIDNIFVKSKHPLHGNSFILCTDISDHFPIFSSFPMGLMTNPETGNKTGKHIYISKHGPGELETFKHELHNLSLYRTIDKSVNADPNENYNIINNALYDLSLKCFPVKKVRLNKKKHKLNPWMTDTILRCVNRKKSYYIAWKKSNPLEPNHVAIENRYRRYDSMLKKIIRKRKLEFNCSYFNCHKNDMRKTWARIKYLTVGKTSNELDDIHFKLENKLSNDPAEVANYFNNFFSSVGERYANEIPPVHDASHLDYFGNNIASTFEFHPVNRNEVARIISNLSNKDSSGHDNIAVKLLKTVKDDLVDCLTFIINQTIISGIFPQKLKIAKIVPVFKNGSRDEIGNYRPISVLPSVSKVFEKVMANQLYDYFEINKLLPHCQYAYRKGHSTEHASLEFVDQILQYLDEDKIPLAIFIDLSKAFDTLDHSILLSKLEKYGLSELSLRLITSYLTNRSHYVQWNHSRSVLKNITMGVPQGSILGPLLYVIYMADLDKSSDVFNFIFYADDTTMYVNLGNETNDDVLNNEICKVVKWLRLNKLTINAKKTKLMVFSYRKVVQEPQLMLNGIPIMGVDSFNFLGLTIDKQLSWKMHLNKVALKITRTNFILNKLKRFLPTEIMRIIYFSLIQCHFNFGILHWGHTIRDNDIMSRLQKRAIRIISNSNYRCHTTPLNKKLKIIKLVDLFHLFTLKFVYNYVHKNLPSYFLTSFVITRNRDIHPHNTRNDSIRYPRVKKNKTSQCVRYYFYKAWENYPDEIINKVNTHSMQGFSQYVKKFYLDSYNSFCELPNCYVCQNYT